MYVFSSVRIDTVCVLIFFFFNDTATTEIYTLSLHDALPIFEARLSRVALKRLDSRLLSGCRIREALGLAHGTRDRVDLRALRSEEHTSELQSRQYLVCRLLLEKKKTYNNQ